MRFNVHLTHWSLLFITLVSSCFLFFVVATENAKYVAAAAAANTATADEDIATAAAAPTAAETTEHDLNAAAALHAESNRPQEEVLRNYKKVKKLINENVVTTHVPVAAFDVDATAKVADKAETENTAALVSDDASTASVVESMHDNVLVAADANAAVAAAENVEASKNKAAEGVENPQTDEATQTVEQQAESLPDISEIPTIKVTELPLEVLEPTRSTFDTIIIDVPQDSVMQERENRTVDISENSDETLQKDEQMIKFNDSGGEAVAAEAAVVSEKIPNESAKDIPSENATDPVTAAPTATVTTDEPSVPTNASDAAAGANLTAEEIPIPVFSEWAQKQMEAAEKQQAKEQEDVNTSTQKKNHTNGGNKAPPLKIRAKNYASPDCGAKIIASNADASNTGAVLSSSKDEYMLSPCGNRIWFVVELCEAIQAQKVDLANFELFSSSPKNFTVAVSNRFPTRDWSNVGRFIAEDKRNVQSFDLHPHLFGKFVRVDIHSHYSKEHFCPVSLFRVFGTSEFEAFETENQPNEDLDDFDDEFAFEQAHAKNSEQNLFKSASDAVLSIVKKAAEALAKPASNQNQTLIVQSKAHACQTPATGKFSCTDCSLALVERINNALSCEFQALNSLLSIQRLRNDLLNTQVCAKAYGINTPAMSMPNEDCNMAQLPQNTLEMDIKRSYFLNLLPTEYVGALCQLLAMQAAPQTNNTHVPKEHKDEAAELALNLTIDKKLGGGEFKDIENAAEQKLLKTETAFTGTGTDSGSTGGTGAGSSGSTTATIAETENAALHQTEAAEIHVPTTESAPLEDTQMQRPTVDDATAETTTTPTPEAAKEASPDVNIFNVVSEEKAETATENTERSNEHDEHATVATTAAPSTTTTTTEGTSSGAQRSEEDPSSWESLDNLLTSTVATVTIDSVPQAGGNAAPSNGVNLQQKIPSGPQSESVFIRLSNRIKALERNMSLSGQYLEELSRRYKKQVEELQVTLTQQAQTVRQLEEQNRRHSELELLHAQQNTQLKSELDDLTLQVHACIVVIIFVGAFVFLVLMVGILFYRSMRRETKELLALHAICGKRKVGAGLTAHNAHGNAIANQKKLHRRKSFEDFSDHQQTLSKGSEKQRRPSEEAMLILKDCSGDANASSIEQVGDVAQVREFVGKGQLRQRKISVCYGSNNNVNGVGSRSGGNKINNNNKRKGEKHSWPSSNAGGRPWQLFERADEDYDCFGDDAAVARNKIILPNGQSQQNGGKAKKKSKNLKRQESAPCEFPTTTTSSQAPTNSDYDESLLLDEDDLDNFIPNADLVYNEFMPDGPSGYQIVNDAVGAAGAPTNNDAADSTGVKVTTKKSLRLTSPAFFKSPFSKSLKLKANNATSSVAKTKPAHESTSWEWYRLRKSESQHQQIQRQQQVQTCLPTSASAGSFVRVGSPANSVDSSSLSEIHFPTNSTQNSFRILEEAILSSGELRDATGTTITATAAAAAAAANGNGASSGGSSSNRSSTSSTSKKKSRSFNKLFRKVF